MRKYVVILAAFSLALYLHPHKVGARTDGQSPNLTADEVIEEINALRTSKDLPAYRKNSILMVIAQEHAEYMARTGVIKHYGADGSRPYQRAIAAGYSVDGDLTFGGYFSENIEAGTDLSPSDVVEIWQENSNNLKTMISPDYMDVGVGVAVENGITYYVLDAGSSTDFSMVVPPEQSTGVSPGSGQPETQTAPVVRSTPLRDGAIYHFVQSKETLWSIALAYDVSVDELKMLNRLSSNDIFVGQKLLIAQPEIKITSTPAPTITVTFGIPTSTATRPRQPTMTSTVTPVPTPPASRQNGVMVAGGILILAMLAAGIGAWLGKKKQD